MTHLEPGPLVLLRVHDELEGVAALPQVVSVAAHHGHQVAAVPAVTTLKHLHKTGKTDVRQNETKN